MDEQPFDWWHSGRYWYCSLSGPPGYKVSGCGTTKDEAIRDAQRDRLKLVGRLRLRAEKEPERLNQRKRMYD